MGTIYCIENQVNHKKYIGITIQDLAARWAQHKRALRKNEHVNCKLQAAWNKYGESQFIWRVLQDDCALSELYQKEIEYIQLFDSSNNGYNLTRGGDKGASELFEKTVYVYNLQGQYVKQFHSRAEAQRQLDCHSVKECCLGSCKRGFSKTDNQWYMFSYEYHDSLPIYENNNVHAKVFYKLNAQGEVIESYPSLRAAGQAHGIIALSHLRESAQTHKMFHNCYWCFKEDYNATWKPYSTDKIVAYFKGQEVGRYPSAMAAGRALGISNSGVSRALKNGRPTCGYTFQFIEKEK